MSQVELINVTKQYNNNTIAVRDLSLHVEQGEFFSLLGPSGCGKTTTLRMIAGFVRPTTGAIRIQGQDVTRLPPEKRNIGIVFQNYAIFPHMNVAQNIGFGLRLRKLPQTEIDAKVQQALKQVNLEGYEERRSDELSGGEQQRVALARVIVLEPRLLLLDEPLSALDKKLRDEMRLWLKHLQHELGITTIYVTHDQDEALSLSDRLAVMSKGEIQQVGTPKEIYEHPRERFVADFIGESNMIPARIASVNGTLAHLTLPGEITCETTTIDRALSEAGRNVLLMVRPEHLTIEAANGSGTNRYAGTLEEDVYQGSLIRYLVRINEDLLVTAEVPNTGSTALTRGQAVTVGWKPEHAVVLPT